MSSRSFGRFTVRCTSINSLARAPIIIFVLLGSDKQLPKPQRRGAIIILGMLALARRSVVTERVDTLLKVGLGPLGKVGCHLFQIARFYLMVVVCRPI